MISSLGKMFSLRFDELSKVGEVGLHCPALIIDLFSQKIDWMEANQRNFMKGNEWTEISEGKRIRKSAEQRNWTDGKNVHRNERQFVGNKFSRRKKTNLQR